MPHYDVDGVQLEYAWHGPRPDQAPTIVFLHEGLGCVSMWRDFPAELAAATGLGAMVYSRRGYGTSDPCELLRQPDFMHVEGLEVLPRLVEVAELREFLLVGHSDGASIALVYAGNPAGYGYQGLKGVMVEAPHVMVEEISVQGIKQARQAFENGDLRQRLERHHGDNVDCAFYGWSLVWLENDFCQFNIEEYVACIEVPLQVIQGEGDDYGTPEQLATIGRALGDGVELNMWPDCGHSPHQERPEKVLAAMTRFIGESLN